MNGKEFLWVEQYRPNRIEDIVLTDEMRKTFANIVKNGELHNMTLAGSAGIGKTTVARALCDEMGLDWILINASEESGIDTLRNKIRNFASTLSLEGSLKVVILDEADHLNATSTQPALRGFMEEFSANCRFILTCNFKDRIIEPLLSRCPVISFNTNRKVMMKLAEQFYKKVLKRILEENEVEYSEKAVIQLVVKYAPDWRKILNILHRHAVGGKIDTDVLLDSTDLSMTEVISYLKEKEFRKMRTWVACHADMDGQVTFRGLYDALFEQANPKSVPGAILIINDYMYKACFVADKEINLVACLTELMSEVEWK